MKVTAANATKILVHHEYEFDWNGYLDTASFRQYCHEVKKAIKAIGRAGTRDIKSHFKSDHHRWLMDAIEALSSTEDIRQVAFGCIKRWAVSKQRPQPERRFNGSDRLDKSDKVLPYSGIKNESPTYSYNK